MAKKNLNTAKNGRPNTTKEEPRSITHFERGIDTDTALVNACLALAGDLIAQRIPASIGNSVNGTVRNMLKLVELKYKFGAPTASGHQKVLALV